MRMWKLYCVMAVLCLLVQTNAQIINPIIEKNVDKQTPMAQSRNSLNISHENYPRVDGSTSAHPLQILIACEMLGLSCYWSETGWDERKYLVADSEESGNLLAENFINNEINHHGTHGSYVNLIENRCDLILVARRPSQDEIDLATENGVGLVIEPVALDAFVFVVNSENLIDNLGLREIQEIYSGNITNWREVGGNDAEINPYQRNDNSGSQELMEELVMKGLNMINAPEMILYGMMGPINRLSEDVDGLGYSVYFFEEFMAPNERIKLIGIDGVYPDYGNISTGDYALTTEVYAVIRDDLDPSNNSYKLRDWLLTEEGQRAVRKSGYVPLEPIDENDKGTPTLPSPEIDELEEICFVGDEFNITWSEIEGASTYVLQRRYGLVNYLWDYIYCGKELSYYLHYDYYGDKPLWFRVKAMGVGYKDSLYSEPYIIFPQYSPDDITGPPVEFLHGNRSFPTGDYWINWTEAPNATRYYLQESMHSDFKYLTLNRGRFDPSYHVINNMNGTYFYRARALYNDSVGPWSKVITVHVGVPNSPPSINVSNPKNGDTVFGKIDIGGMIDDDNFDTSMLLIQVKIGAFGPWIGITNISDNGQWQYNWDTIGFANGDHTLYFRGYDGQVYSSIITVQVRICNLIIEMSFPQSGDIVSQDVHFGGSFYYDIYNVNKPIIQMKILGLTDWVNITYTLDHESWSISWNTTELENDNFTVFIRGIQDANVSNLIQLELKVRNTIIKVNSHLNGETVSEIVLISGSLEYDESLYEKPVFQARIGQNGKWINIFSILNDFDWQFVWNSAEVNNGNYRIFFRVVDWADYSEDSNYFNMIQLHLKVRNTIFTVDSPSNGDIITDVVLISGTLEFDESLTEKPIIQIKIGLIGGWTNITNITNNSEWQFVWNSTEFNNGNYTIFFRILDREHYSEIKKINLVVNNSKIIEEKPDEEPDNEENDEETENDDGNVSVKKKDVKKSRSVLVIMMIIIPILIVIISVAAYVIIRKKSTEK